MMIRATRAMYLQLWRAFRFVGCLGEWSRATNGVLQGCPLSAVLINLLTTVWKRRIDQQQNPITLRVESLPPRLGGQDPAESTRRSWVDEDSVQETMTSASAVTTEDVEQDMTDDGAETLSMMEDAKSPTSMLSAESLAKVTEADLVEHWRLRGHEIRSPSPPSQWDSASTCTP